MAYGTKEIQGQSQFGQLVKRGYPFCFLLPNDFPYIHMLKKLEEWERERQLSS